MPPQALPLVRPHLTLVTKESHVMGGSDHTGDERISSLLETLTKGIAHDMNNHLARLSGLTEQALSQLSARSQAVRSTLTQSQSAIERMSCAVERLLIFAGVRSPNRQHIPVEELFVELSKSISTLPYRVDLTARVDHAFCVLGDLGMLRVAVTNLTDNAAEALGRSSGRIRVTLRATKLGRRAQAELLVEDDGPGIDSSKLARALDPYQGKCTHLPSKATSSTYDPVLIVEDDDLIRELLTNALDREGRAWLAVSSASEARPLLKSASLLLTDYSLPGCTGLELARHAQVVRPDLPMIMMSGHLPASESDLLLGGFCSVLTKPFALDQLSAALEAAIGPPPSSRRKAAAPGARPSVLHEDRI